ncbi:MAG: phospholipid carrier-dependent glycosyltransferase [Gammaproteobacteria bacterium]|nr:MAG: phospholipid carrier-dependent glycosyltransferase [Gammaproteobacteria bacterium]
MPERRIIAGLLVAWASLRLALAVVLPLGDTTEARYAWIAREMARSGDWITPWFAPGVPFWGKPPLAFWAQALSVRAFGEHEWALRLPALLATAALAGLVWDAARRRFDPDTAWRALLVFTGGLLVFTVSATVSTDPFLALGVGLVWWAAMTAERGPPTGVGFAAAALGIAVGLLAKGPLVLLWVAPPLLLDAWRRPSRALRWGGAVLLGLSCALPWYWAAETKTPGFLRYFIVGEHFERYLVPGWAGDRYGGGHARAPGTVLLYTALALLPWTPWLLRRPRPQDDGERRLLPWMLWPLLLLLPARNLLATYVLPAMPAWSLWLAPRLDSASRRRWIAAALVTVLACTMVGAAVWPGTPWLDRQRSAWAVVAAWRRYGSPGGVLYTAGPPPYSLRYYADGAWRTLPASAAPPTGACRLAGVDDAPPAPGLHRRAAFARYALWCDSGKAHAGQGAAPRPAEQAEPPAVLGAHQADEVQAQPGPGAARVPHAG